MPFSIIVWFALIMQCVSSFLQFPWATGLLLGQKLSSICSASSSFFFGLPWSWSPFSTCSPGPSAPCMVRLLWLVCWSHLRSLELLWAVVWPEPCLYLFSVIIWNRFLVEIWKQITFHTSPTFLFFEHLSPPALQVYRHHLRPACWDCLLFWPEPQFLLFRVSIWHRFLIAFRQLPLSLFTTCSSGLSVCMLPLIEFVCKGSLGLSETTKLSLCPNPLVLQRLHLKQIFFYICSLSLVCNLD